MTQQEIEKHDQEFSDFIDLIDHIYNDVEFIFTKTPTTTYTRDILGIDVTFKRNNDENQIENNFYIGGENFGGICQGTEEITPFHSLKLCIRSILEKIYLSKNKTLPYPL